MRKAKPESKWHVIVIGGKKAEFVGVVTAPNAESAERKAAEKFGIAGERCKRLLAQLALR
jgi:hypothetical protein